MRTYVVGVFHTHEDAEKAVRQLIDAGFSNRNLSIVGKIEEIDGHLQLPPSEKSGHAAPVAVGTTVGTIAGLLTGVGIFAIPGLGFLYGAGALVGALAGFDLGLMAGGGVSIIGTLTDEHHDTEIDQYLHANHYAVLYKGERREEAAKELRALNAVDVFE